MATRRERVILELEDRLSPGMIRTAIATKLADDAVSDLGGSTISTNKTLDVSATQARKQARSLDDLESSARRAERGSSALLDIAVGFGPAFLPVTAVAIPAVAGLAAELGFLAGAAGTTILAFNGVSDALKALDAYQLDPSTQNLQKMNEQMSKLGPAGRAFVRELDSLEPKLKSLKLAAEGGILPGATDALDSLLTRMPQVRRIVSEISEATGDLFADAGDSLAGSDYNEFFDYLEINARPILDDLGRTVGNLTLGMANLFTATAPEQQDFSDWLLSVSRDFANWSDNLPENAGFRELMDYIDESGPQVADTLGAIGNAVVQIAQAAAPVSIPALKALETLANIIGKIADSPIGTPLIALASGLALVNRALSLSALAKNSLVADLLYGKPLTGGGRGPNALGQVRGKVTGLSASVKAENIALRAAQQEQALILNRLRDQAQAGALVPRSGRQQSAASYVASQKRIEEATKRVTEAEKARSAQMKANRGSFAEGGLYAAGTAAVMTGLTDQLNLSNTATLALAGSFLAPGAGTAAGAVVGGFLDLKEASADFTAGLDELNAAVERGDIDAAAKQIEGLNKQLADLNQQSGFGDSISDAFGRVSGTLSGNIQGGLGGGLLGKADAVFKAGFGQTAGLLSGDVSSPSMEADVDTAKAQQELAAMNVQADLAAMGLRTTAAGARELTSSTEEMARVLNEGQAALNQAAAVDNYKAALDNLNDAVKENGKTLDNNTPKGRANRAALRGIAQAARDAAEGMKGADKIRFQDNARKSFIRAAIAAGKGREAAKALADEYGLVDRVKATPKVDDKTARNKLEGILGISRSVGKQRPTVRPKVANDEAKASGRILRAYLERVFGAPITQRVNVVNRVSPNKRPDGGTGAATGGGSRTGGGSTSRTYTSDSARSASRTVVQVTTPSLDGVRLGGTVRIDGNMLNLDDAYLVAEEVVGNAFAGRESTARTQYAASSPGLPSGFE